MAYKRCRSLWKSFFLTIKFFRADRDSISSEEEMKQFIKIVEQKSAQIIIGTQMLSKGLDFPSISLVGLILADLDFYMPDFRAEERAFQTLLQMAGRAGRKSPGEVILQTFNPEHSGILFARQHNYTGFFYEEMKNRKKWSYPPFSRLCLVRIDSLKEKAGQDFAEKLGQKAISLSTQGITILGPSPAPLAKIKNRWRFQILIKAESHKILDSFLYAFLPQIRKRAFIHVKVDRDPGFML